MSAVSAWYVLWQRCPQLKCTTRPHAASHPPGENTGGQRELKHAGEQEIGGDRDDEGVRGITKRAP